MKIKTIASAAALAATLLTGSGAFAVPLVPTVSFSPGSTLTTTGLSSFTTSGTGMSGMSVTAYFSGGSSETVSWAAGVSPAGAATGTNWSLGFAGATTFSPFWELLTTGNLAASITRLVIDGRPGDTIFDTINGTETTPGSANGLPFSDVDGPADLLVSASYTNQVALNGTIYGDLFTILDIGFAATTGTAGDGLRADSRLIFTADTDNTALAGDITTVPEPTTMALLSLGLLGLGCLRRKARNGH